MKLIVRLENLRVVLSLPQVSLVVLMPMELWVSCYLTRTAVPKSKTPGDEAASLGQILIVY